MNKFLKVIKLKSTITKFLYCCILFCSYHFATKAQPDNFVGNWKTEIQGNPNCIMQLHIATVQQSVLYPAYITIQCDSFLAKYELLLAKKSTRELAVSKNKFSLIERPFSLGKATFYFNGILDYSRDLKGYPTLQLSRVQQKFIQQLLPDTSMMNAANKKMAIRL